MLKKQPRLFWIGLLLYVVSFFLVTFLDSFPERGYQWAVWTVVLPLAWQQRALQHGSPFAGMPFTYAAFVTSGLINVTFLVAMVVRVSDRPRLLFSALRSSVIAMTLFSWVAMYRFALIPREGYVLWLIGMLTALFTPLVAAPKIAISGMRQGRIE